MAQYSHRYLIENSDDIDLNAGLDPALHLALRQKHTAIAHLLLQSGADYEIKDSVSTRNTFNHIGTTVFLGRGLPNTYSL